MGISEADSTEGADSTGLTQRECDILALVAGGLSNQTIAARLQLREQTVKNRISDILAKLGVDNRTQAALWARENGLRPPPIAPEKPEFPR